MKAIKLENIKMGKYLRSLRHQFKLTQPDAALAYGMSTSYVAKLEAGQHKLSPRICIGICKFYNISPENFLAKAEILDQELLKKQPLTIIKISQEIETLTVIERAQVLNFIEKLRANRL